MRLQGHRRRRRSFKVRENSETGSERIDWTEFKTIKQYRSMGEMLDEFRVYGYREGVENILNRSVAEGYENGHSWLTLDPDLPDGLQPEQAWLAGHKGREG